MPTSGSCSRAWRHTDAVASRAAPPAVGSERYVNGEAIDGYFTSGQLDENAEPGDRVADGAVGTSPTKPARLRSLAGRAGLPPRSSSSASHRCCWRSATRASSRSSSSTTTRTVIGLALLGIGCGSVVTAISPRPVAKTDTIIMLGCYLVGAASVIVGYLIVARLPIASLAIWDYGTGDSLWNSGHARGDPLGAVRAVRVGGRDDLHPRAQDRGHR